MWYASQLIIQKNSIIGNTYDLSTSFQSCVIFLYETIILSQTNPNVKLTTKKMKFMSNSLVTKLETKFERDFTFFSLIYVFSLCPICKPISSMSNMEPLQLYNVGTVKFREKWCSGKGSNLIYISVIVYWTNTSGTKQICPDLCLNYWWDLSLDFISIGMNILNLLCNLKNSDGKNILLYGLMNLTFI